MFCLNNRPFIPKKVLSSHRFPLKKKIQGMNKSSNSC